MKHSELPVFLIRAHLKCRHRGRCEVFARLTAYESMSIFSDWDTVVDTSPVEATLAPVSTVIMNTFQFIQPENEDGNFGEQLEGRNR